MPPWSKSISAAQALRIMTASQPEPKNKTKNEELRLMYGRFENAAAWIRQHGNGGKIILPLPPAMTNGIIAKAHWHTKDELKEAYWNHCDALLYSKLVPKAPAKPPSLVRCHVVIFTSLVMDGEGGEARRKWPQDWLKKNGYIRDDAPKYFQVTSEAVTVPRKQVRIEFEVEPLEV